ncbi:MAG: hypothetical protein LBI31_00780 [Zoogloeaceae bacterium]|jgi:hypothetical protein|nr:hypothetical protein [Zoogloeaceae bacterium]
MTFSTRRRFLRVSLLPGLLFLPLAACMTRRKPDGREERDFDPKYLAKTDMDRVSDASRSQVMDSLFLLAEKLYRRNPREWKKAGFGRQEEAVEALRGYRETAPEGLAGEQEGKAVLRAFAPDYPGDRVAALIYGLLTMVDAAYEHKDEFFILDSLNAQKLYNSARNVEIAAWKLASTHDESGKPLLLSNEMEDGSRNLSFEREFGRIIGQLDFIALVTSDRSGRAVTGVSQSLATAVFLPVGMLK